MEKFLDTENFEVVNIEYEISLQEKEMLELGTLPLSMDDKWFQYCENNTFHFFRSWTGIEIFRGEIIQVDETKWRIENVIASKEFKKNTQARISLLQDLLKYGIQRKMRLYQKK